MPEDDLEVFARNLRTLREGAGMTQEQLALASGLDMSNVSRYEAGVREPGVRILFRIARALDVQPGRLLDT